MTAPKVAGILLAAGLSVRTAGVDKLQLPLAGKPIWRHALDNALASRLGEIFWVVRPGCEIAAVERSGRVTVVENVDYREGISASIRSGVTAARNRCGGFLILLADLPNLKPKTIDRYLLAFEAGSRLVAARRGSEAGSPALFHLDFADELVALTGDRGARSILTRHSSLVTTLDVHEDELLDVDTFEAYEKLKCRMAPPPGEI